MDVIQPQLIWIGQRCYRKNPVASSYGGGGNENDERQSFRDRMQLSGPYEVDDYEDEACNAQDNVPVEQLGDGRFRVSMSVASEYFPKIIGRNGDNKRQMERETKTSISIPRKGQTGNLIITGFTQKDVSSAFIRISLIVSAARKKMPFTHFISVPLTAPEIKARLALFKEEVMSIPRNHYEEDLFQNPDKLHLTIGTLVLLNQAERDRAASALTAFRERIPELIGSEPLEISVRGVDYMNDDPEQVDVLYGQIVDPSGRLQRLSDAVIDSLEADGLLDRQYQRVKLHATLMNSIFAATDEEGGERRTFNAKPILERFKGYEFGKQLVEGLHLSERYSTSPVTKYYMSTAQITLM